MQWKCSGRILCWFLEEDISAVPELNKIVEDFIISRDGMYDIEPEKVRLIRYPMGWPRLLQQIIPCVLFERGNALPLDWVRLRGDRESAREIRAVLDEVWMRNLIKGAKESTTGGRFEGMLPWLTIGISGVCLLMIFVLMTKVGG